MTDGKKPRPRKKVPTLQELDDMSEGGTGQSVTSGKGKPTSSTNRRNIRIRKGVGRNKKVVNAPPAKPKSKSASKPDKAETTAKQSDSTSSRTRVTSVKVKKSTSRSQSKPPAPESSQSSGGSGRTPPPPPKTPPASEPPEPSPKQSKDEYARTMALYKAEEEWGHQMGDFDRLPNDGGRNRAYESKCVGCGRRAIAKVQYLENYSDVQGVPGWHGDATEGPCSPKPRRRTVHKTDTDKRPDTKSGKDPVSRQDSVKSSGGSTSGYQKGSPSPSSSRRPMKSSRLKKSIRNRVRTLPAGLKIPKPSPERILGNKARDEARRKAKERGHRISEFILFAYPEVEGYIVYRGRCGKCHRVALGMVKQHSDEAGKSGSILVSGDALQHRCSGSSVKR